MKSFAIADTPYAMGPREFDALRSMIHKHTGIWLRDGKQVMLASRLSRRLRHFGISDFAEYYAYVQKAPADSEEIRELINAVTTNKTSFFRERHHFEFLLNHVVPELRLAAPPGCPRSIRVWSAACSTGEEPYTIAITLLEACQTLAGSNAVRTAKVNTSPRGFGAAAGSWKLEVVASDIDTNVLGIGQRAIYSAESLASVAAPLQKKYFLRGKDDMQGRVKVKPEVSRLVHFKRVNLQDAHWPLEGVFDVIFFRNALIYFKRETQEIYLRKMVRYLKPRGYLFLGNAEHIPWLHDILEPLKQTMYRLREGVR
ncbi:MAG: CheR family methyltransferase [Terriglobia bacterium]